MKGMAIAASRSSTVLESQAVNNMAAGVKTAIPQGLGGFPSGSLPLAALGFLSWWTAGGSNPRPPDCEPGALPAELAARRQGPYRNRQQRPIKRDERVGFR
jgi:hypothetical protein